jgi:predicted DNA-binding transcriptional regulator AlpA
MSAPILTLPEVAARYRTTRQTVRAWLRSGKFPRPIRLPSGRPRWTQAVLEQWEAAGGAVEKGRAA